MHSTDIRSAALAAVFVSLALSSCKKDPALPFGKPGEPFGALAKLRFGEPDADAVESVPELVYTGYTGKWEPDGSTIVLVHSKPIARTVKSIWVSFRDRKLADLEKAWGPGTPGKGVNDATSARYYFNAARTIRVKAEDQYGKLEVRFVPMVPLTTLLGDDPTSFGGVKLLGATANAVHAAAGQAGYATGPKNLETPTIEWNNDYTVTYWRTNDAGIITSYRIALETGLTPTAQKDVRDVLDKKWGKAKPGKDILGEEVLVYRDAGPRITLAHAPDNDTAWLEIAQAP